MRRFCSIVGRGLVLATLLAVADGQAQRQTYTVGVDGPGWRELASRWIALDDTTVAGAIQPRELRPGENVMVGTEEASNIFNFQWHTTQFGMESLGRELGVNPRIWAGHFLSDPGIQLVDGSPKTAFQVLQVIDQEEFDSHATATGGAFSAGFRQDWREAWTFDLAFTLPIERIRFFPPQSGVDTDGVPLKRRAPQGFELSVTDQPQDFLLLTSEELTQQSPPAPLDNLVLRTLLNNESIVDLEFDLQPVRFVRIFIGLMRQAYSMAEFEVYGRGVPPRVEFVSQAIDLGRPVNFGKVEFEFVKWRRGDDDSLAEDPDAPATILLQTRSGLDDSPRSHFVIDELGRDVQVTEEEYDRSDLPKSCCVDLRLPGVRSAITEDTEQWSPWSSPYQDSGLQNRSPDARRWLQFRFDLATEDLLAFGQLRSLRFEYSPLLAADVVGELFIVDEPNLEVLSVIPGMSRQVAIDVATTFETGQDGYDAIRLDVPPGTRFAGLQLGDGESFNSIDPDSLRQDREEVAVFFPTNRVEPSNPRIVRVLLDASVYNSTTVFTGDIIDTQSPNFPQSIDAGDANASVPSNSLQIFADQERLQLLSGVELSSPVLTPNGDGINDVIHFRFQLMAVDEARVAVEIHDLTGRRLVGVGGQILGQGLHDIEWDGTASGLLVPPGMYLARIVVDTDMGDGERVLTVPVVY